MSFRATSGQEQSRLACFADLYRERRRLPAAFSSPGLLDVTLYSTIEPCTLAFDVAEAGSGAVGTGGHASPQAVTWQIRYIAELGQMAASIRMVFMLAEFHLSTPNRSHMVIDRKAGPLAMRAASSQVRNTFAGRNGPVPYGIALVTPSPVWSVFEHGSVIVIPRASHSMWSTSMPTSSPRRNPPRRPTCSSALSRAAFNVP